MNQIILDLGIVLMKKKIVKKLVSSLDFYNSKLKMFITKKKCSLEVVNSLKGLRCFSFLYENPT